MKLLAFILNISLECIQLKILKGTSELKTTISVHRGMVQILIGVFNTFPSKSSSPSPAKDTRGDISITFSDPSIVAPAASRKLL